MADLFSSGGTFNLDAALGNLNFSGATTATGPILGPYLPGADVANFRTPGILGLTSAGQRAFLFGALALLLYVLFFKKG